ncbi:MAG: hypothetical protein R3B47_21875 [Bacteroidia bacterium]
MIFWGIIGCSSPKHCYHKRPHYWYSPVPYFSMKDSGFSFIRTPDSIVLDNWSSKISISEKEYSGMAWVEAIFDSTGKVSRVNFDEMLIWKGKWEGDSLIAAKTLICCYHYGRACCNCKSQRVGKELEKLEIIDSVLVELNRLKKYKIEPPKKGYGRARWYMSIN